MSNWPSKFDATVDLPVGTLVRYTWASSNRLALVLDRQPLPRWVSGMGVNGEPTTLDHVLVQWCGGSGPLPNMQTHDGSEQSWRNRNKLGAMGWVMVRTPRGYKMFERA